VKEKDRNKNILERRRKGGIRKTGRRNQFR
jgi:hypothetical protein